MPKKQKSRARKIEQITRYIVISHLQFKTVTIIYVNSKEVNREPFLWQRNKSLVGCVSETDGNNFPRFSHRMMGGMVGPG
jgi:hypothetical protein